MPDEVLYMDGFRLLFLVFRYSRAPFVYRYILRVVHRRPDHPFGREFVDSVDMLPVAHSVVVFAADNRALAFFFQDVEFAR